MVLTAYLGPSLNSPNFMVSLFDWRCHGNRWHVRKQTYSILLFHSVSLEFAREKPHTDCLTSTKQIFTTSGCIRVLNNFPEYVFKVPVYTWQSTRIAFVLKSLNPLLMTFHAKQTKHLHYKNEKWHWTRNLKVCTCFVFLVLEEFDCHLNVTIVTVAKNLRLTFNNWLWDIPPYDNSSGIFLASNTNFTSHDALMMQNPCSPSWSS